MDKKNSVIGDDVSKKMSSARAYVDKSFVVFHLLSISCLCDRAAEKKKKYSRPVTVMVFSPV